MTDSSLAMRPCSAHCWPDREAVVEELVLAVGHVEVGQPVGDDVVGVEEGPQHQVRDVRAVVASRVQLAGSAFASACPSGRDSPQLGVDVGAELVPPGEEEVELEQLAQAQRLGLGAPR